MEITRLGHSSFKIRGKQATVITDPFDPKMLGIKFPKVEARIVTVSHNHNDHNNTGVIEGNPFIITGPGEYEIADVFIRGIPTHHDNKYGEERGKNTIYKIEIDGVRLAHLGDLGHKLSDEQLDQLGDVDVLMIPVGGVYTIDAKKASEVVAQIEPHIVIPMHYNEDRLDREAFGKLSSVEEFFKEMGKSVNTAPKLLISKDKIPVELEVIALE